jgi:hypothetical protein
MLQVSHVQEDPQAFWLSRLKPNTVRTAKYGLSRFIAYLHETQPGYRDVDPRGLLIRQLKNEDPYEILTHLQNYLLTQKVCQGTNQRTYSSVQSYFMHNRAPLPRDPFKVPGFKEPVLGKLTEQDVARIVAAAKPRDRSLIMTKWMGLMDTEGVMYVGEHLSDQVMTGIEKHQNPIRLDLPGRKHTENIKRFFTFIGKDAIDALIFYFDNERGWPRLGESIWLNKFGKPMRARTWPELWLDLIRRAGLIPKMPQHDVGARYGFNTHEMRDAAASLVHTKAKRKGFDMDCAHFFMGHTSQLDPNKYDKFFRDKEYAIEQYRIAEPYLNILSGKQELEGKIDQNLMNRFIQEIGQSPEIRNMMLQALGIEPKHQGGENQK